MTAWKSIKTSPRSIWVIFILKFFEAFSFVSEDFIFILFFNKEFQMDEVECGTVYSIAAGLTFLYGLFISGYLIDNCGVKPCLLLGSFLAAVSRFLIMIVSEKRHLKIIMFTTIPLALSLCKSFVLNRSQ